MDTLTAIDTDLADLIDRATKANEPSRDTRSRELSLVITKLQEARHWLAEATQTVGV